MRVCAYLNLFRKTMRDLIKALKALSDETRLRMLNILLEKECCVCEVMQALDISQSRASRNLGILQESGFLKTRRNGQWMVYSVDWETANKHTISLAKLIKESHIGSETLRQDKERLKKAKRVGAGCRSYWNKPLPREI